MRRILATATTLIARHCGVGEIDVNSRVGKVVIQIQRADYEGNRADLKRLYQELAPIRGEQDNSVRVRYWRGFALWRRALNGFNDSVDPKELEQDLLVRLPAGYVILPPFHDSNERIFVAEGQLTLRQDAGNTLLKSGGFAFLPAHQTQRLSCSSKTRCTFYLFWDGKSDSHPAK